MVKAGRPVRDDVLERDGLETALSELVCLGIVVEEVRIRVEQAMRRTRVVEDVLGPAEGRLAELDKGLRLVQKELQEAWAEEKTRRLG